MLIHRRHWFTQKLQAITSYRDPTSNNKYIKQSLFVILRKNEKSLKVGYDDHLSLSLSLINKYIAVTMWNGKCITYYTYDDHRVIQVIIAKDHGSNSLRYFLTKTKVSREKMWNQMDLFGWFEMLLSWEASSYTYSKTITNILKNSRGVNFGPSA